MKKKILYLLIFLFTFNGACFADIFLGVPERPKREEKLAPSHAWQKRLDDIKKIYLAGDYKACIDELERLLGFNPPNDVKPGLRYLLGLALMQDGRYADARANFNIILSDNAAGQIAEDASLSAADSYYLEGNFDEAFAQYRKFLLDYTASDSASIANFRLGVCARKKGRWDEAAHYFQKVQKEYPLSIEAKQAIELLNQAEAYFSVQVGSFRNEDNAAALAADLKNKGYDIYIVNPKEKGDNFYRVRVGRFSTKSEAQFTEDKLKKEGFPTKILP